MKPEDDGRNGLCELLELDLLGLEIGFNFVVLDFTEQNVGRIVKIHGWFGNSNPNPYFYQSNPTETTVAQIRTMSTPDTLPPSVSKKHPSKFSRSILKLFKFMFKFRKSPSLSVVAETKIARGVLCNLRQDMCTDDDPRDRFWRVFAGNQLVGYQEMCIRKIHCCLHRSCAGYIYIAYMNNDDVVK
ncbi:hypothetical protein F3Y22_tig00116996pilonHSYRG00376 [Hibiscus syriacus]|uniref:Uncharacterized protein n=1 Tax=Hibiscus syriacus TaxID=106335 RepID=A0A6A2X5G8_HIBSY|nr:hypothetical protein F3Y22_tig00116996pilonHSYRG00376 [Hibiscus syriacus]